jgi:transposase
MVKVLCFDEIAPHKGHGRYELVIYAPELGIVLDVLKDRKKATLEGWFLARGPAWCAHVEVYCADMWDQYHEAAQAHLPKALPVVDRFHVMKNLNDAVTKARRSIQRKATPAQQELLKGCRWLLVKNHENLSDAERSTLENLLAASPELKSLYELKESFRTWFNTCADRQQADDLLTTWLDKAKGGGLRAIQGFIRTVERWRQLILNYFVGRYSNGFAEGVNLKIKLINRRAFGYHLFESFRLHVLVAFDMPEEVPL